MKERGMRGRGEAQGGGGGEEDGVERQGMRK